MISNSDIEGWNRFVTEGLVPDNDEQVTRWDFTKMTKRFGKAYIEYLQAAYQALEGSMSDSEFCKYNGNVPQPFFLNKVKKVVS